MPQDSPRPCLLHRHETPLGPMLMRSNGAALTGLCFAGQKYHDDQPASGGQRRGPRDTGVPDFGPGRDLPVFASTCQWLDAYFAGQKPETLARYCPPLALSGTDFRLAVWQILLRIPYGQTISYGQIAKSLASQRGLARMSAQAVGGAVGHNPVAIIVPCHRVVGSNGSLTGYGGGMERKIRLLELEGLDMAGFSVPAKILA